MKSAARSAIIIVGALVLPRGIRGITDARWPSKSTREIGLGLRRGALRLQLGL